MQSQTSLRAPLFWALALYFALTAALIARVPLLQSPDEIAHLQYVQHIAQTGTLPVFRGAAPPAFGYEFHQPPLYYLLCAPWWKLLGADTQSYMCRVVSMLCGLVTIALIWSAARLLFERNPRVIRGATLLAALSPLHQAVGAGANNDGLAGTLAAAIFLLIARMSFCGITRRDAWQFGLVAGLAILTKNTLLTLIFSGFIALIWSCKKPDVKISLLPALGTALGIMLLIGGPWLMRNQSLYGDPLALSAFSGAAKSVAPGFPYFAQVLGMDFPTYARSLAWITFLTGWGFFGGSDSAFALTRPFSANGPRVPQPWLAPLMLICLAAPLLSLLGWRRGARDPETKNEIEAQSDAQSDAGTENENAPQIEAQIAAENRDGRGVALLWGLGVLLVGLAWAQFAFNFFAGAQARYLHPALLPFCLFFAVGWERLFRGKAFAIAGALFGATLLILTLLNLFGWKTLV